MTFLTAGLKFTESFLLPALFALDFSSRLWEVFLVSKGPLTRPIGSRPISLFSGTFFLRPTFFSSFITPLIYKSKSQKSEIRDNFEISKFDKVTKFSVCRSRP